MTATLYPADWLRGLLTTCVLKTLEKGPTYGYAIITQLAEAGLGDIKGALHERGCSAGLKPPASSSDLAA